MNTMSNPESSVLDFIIAAREIIFDITQSLTPREGQIFQLRQGIIIQAKATLEEIAKPFDVSRERIRQIELKTFEKLQHPTRTKRLQPFLKNWDHPAKLKYRTQLIKKIQENFNELTEDILRRNHND